MTKQEETKLHSINFSNNRPVFFQKINPSIVLTLEHPGGIGLPIGFSDLKFEALKQSKRLI